MTANLSACANVWQRCWSLYNSVNSKETGTKPNLEPLLRLTCRWSPIVLIKYYNTHTCLPAPPPLRPEVWFHPIIRRFLSLFSSHRKNWFAARCKYLHLIKKNSQRANRHCEFFLIRCKHSQRAANQFLRWLEKRLNGDIVPVYIEFTDITGLLIWLQKLGDRKWRICRTKICHHRKLCKFSSQEKRQIEPHLEDFFY